MTDQPVGRGTMVFAESDGEFLDSNMSEGEARPRLWSARLPRMTARALTLQSSLWSWALKESPYLSMKVLLTSIQNLLKKHLELR